MLQQTTVATVRSKFTSFLKRFPDLETLACAKEEEVVNEWIGLGYYRRARNLKKACEYFLKNCNSSIPMSYDELIKCPGIGNYTAKAILSIGHNQNTLAIDANIERVLSRFYQIQSKGQLDLKEKIEKSFNEKKILCDMDMFEGRLVNEALMDLGRVVCRASSYDCDRCPIKENCESRINQCQSRYPQKNDKNKKQFELKLLRVVCRHKNKILAYKKKPSQWLAGQLEIPTFILESEDKTLKQYPRYKKKVLKSDLSFKSAITKYKITNVVINVKSIPEKLSEHYEWFELDFRKNNFSTASRKAIKIEKET